ncbi:MAG: glycosyltransferase, partial [Myxococcota bacterium]
MNTLLLLAHDRVPVARGALEQRFPDARWVVVGEGPAGELEQFSFRQAALALARLPTRPWDTVVAVHAHGRLRALAAVLPARTRLQFHSGVLEELTPVRETLRFASRMRGRIESSRGPRNTGDSGRSGNNYGHLSPSAPLALKRFPTVTVVVPVYNRKEALGRTLAGLAHQNYPDERYEVVVADDGSADAPESLAELFNAHLNLRFLRQEDQGYRLSAARNLGIRSSDSELVVSLDCDMIPLPGLLRAY